MNVSHFSDIRKTASIAAIVFLWFASASYAQTPPATPATPALTFSSLRTLIERNNVRSIDELLPLLPESYRSNYALVFDSRGRFLRSVTGDFPRVVLYGPDAHLMLGFVTNPARPGYHQLETIEFNEESESFVLRNIDFSNRRTPLIQEQGTSSNIQRCVNCHGGEQSQRPNWDPYNFWIGVYGSRDREARETILSGSQEAHLYRSFLRTNRNRGRLALLPQLPAQRIPQGIAISNGSQTQPNSRLNDLLLELNLRRIVRIIRQSHQYNRFKFALLARALGCVPADIQMEDFAMSYRTPGSTNGEWQQPPMPGLTIEGLLPPRLQSSGPALNSLRTEVSAVIRSEFANRVAALRELSGQEADGQMPVNFAAEPHEADMAAEMRYFMDRMSVSMSNWSLAFENGTYDLTTSHTTFAWGEVWNALLVAMIRSHDPDLAPYLSDLVLLENPFPNTDNNSQRREGGAARTRAIFRSAQDRPAARARVCPLLVQRSHTALEPAAGATDTDGTEHGRRHSQVTRVRDGLMENQCQANHHETHNTFSEPMAPRALPVTPEALRRLLDQ